MDYDGNRLVCTHKKMMLGSYELNEEEIEFYNYDEEDKEKPELVNSLRFLVNILNYN